MASTHGTPSASAPALADTGNHGPPSVSNGSTAALVAGAGTNSGEATRFAAALIGFGCKRLLAQPKVRRQWDRFILHAPVVGVLNRKICTARFASTLSNLYGSGVPIITTLAAARDAIGNRWIESQFGDALDSIRAGHSLSEAIAGIDGFEVKLSSSVAVGEETGKLDSLLATISETLDYEAEMATKRLVTLLEPVMIVVMGLVVGGVVAAVIVPIYQSYGTIGASSGAI